MKKIAIYGTFNDGMRAALHEKCPAGFTVSEVPLGELRELAQADYVVCRAVAMTDEIFVQLPNLKLLQKWGAGYDKIDVEAAGAHGIPVAVCVGGNALPVAELAVTLMLSVLRNTVALTGRMQRGEWARNEFAERSYLLHGKTVGLVGIGNVAKKTAEILKGGFACNILYYDVFRMSEEQERALGVTYADLDTLMKESDIVSIHVPLLDSTAGMIDHSKLALMKPTACLINTSRGGVVNEADLIDALQQGKILGAGLDTYEKEPLDVASPLLHMECVVTTPHAGGNTVDNDVNMAAICMNNIAQFDADGDKTMRAIVNQNFLKD